MAENPTINVRLHFLDGRKPLTMNGVNPEVTRLFLEGTTRSFIVTDEIDDDGYVICREERPET